VTIIILPTLLLAFPINPLKALDLETTSIMFSTASVSGIINKNTVWKVADAPYVVTGNVIVDTNITLTIEPGVMVKFAGYYYLMVKGTLNAIGNPKAPIIFAFNASSPSVGDWKGIQSSGFNSNMNFNHTKIQYASIGIYNNNGNITIANSEISFNDVGIYYFQHSHVNKTYGEIVNNVIKSNNIGVQIDVEYGPVGNLKLENNAIISNYRGIILDFFNKEDFRVLIMRSVISLNNASGIEIDGGVPGSSSVNITQNYVTFNRNTGIYLNLWRKDAENVFLIEDNDAHNNTMYDFRLGGQYISHVDYTYVAGSNYWGTIDTISIDEKIYDFLDDHKLGKVNYLPTLNSPLESRYPDLDIDYVKPNLSVYQLSNGTFIGFSNVSFTWNAQDAGSGIDHYVVELDDSQEVNVGMVMTHTLENLSEGSHKVYVFAFDKRANIGEALINFVIDLSPPVISHTSVANASEIRASTLNLTWSGADAISGLDHYEIKLDKDVWINLDGQSNHTFTYLTDGRHTIIIKALDKAQNSEEITINLIVNTSFLWGPGWIDDAAFFGGISVVIFIGAYYFFLKERRPRVKEAELSSA